MPPRYLKRRRYSVGARSYKRRRVSFRGRYANRRFGFRRRSFRTRRSRVRRFRGRFKRRFRRSFRRRSKRSQRLKFSLAEVRTATHSFGQQHTVPNNVNESECIYFTTEQSDPSHTLRAQTMNRALGGITDILNIADYLWGVTPDPDEATSPATVLSENYRNKIFLKGQDVYRIRNQCNETIRLTGYYCKARSNDKLNADISSLNVYNYLGAGFSEAGLLPLIPTGDNAYLEDETCTPFMSHRFVRQFKIMRVKNIVIPAGETVVRKLKYGWHTHMPVDYTYPSGTSGSWATRALNATSIKGEKFILWKLHCNIGGVPSQTALEKDITQTTPTVIMETLRTYWFKMLHELATPSVTFTTAGHQSSTASIIIDEDEKAGAEIDAS